MVVLETTSAVVGLALPAIKLIEKIIQAAPKATQNKADCDDLKGRLFVLRKLLVRLRLEGPEAPEALSGLCDALREALELVVACQNWSAERKLAFSGDLAERFIRVNRRIDSHLNLINLCSQVDTSLRLDQIVPPASTSMVAADVYKEGGNDHTRFFLFCGYDPTRFEFEATVGDIAVVRKAPWKKRVRVVMVQVLLVTALVCVL